MKIDEVYMLLCEKIESSNVKKEEPMKRYTTFKIGGPADLMVLPKNVEQLKYAIETFRSAQVPYFIMGNGSNLLVSDHGYRGGIIKIGSGLSRIEVEGNQITAQSGALMSQLAGAAADAGLTGLEFAAGIPGSVGGGLFMNAGAYDGEMKDVVCTAEILTADGTIKTVALEEMDLGYRHSGFQKTGNLILQVTSELQPGNPSQIREKMRDFNQRRNDKQPVTFPSAGSTFKRPPGYFAGKLVQDAGCRGLSVGGARVSPKHSGFIINENNATAEDVINLIRIVQAAVLDQFGVNLETEVRILGDI